MKVFISNKLDNYLEFGCIVVASSEKEAKKKVLEDLIRDGWEFDEDHIRLEEVDLTYTHTKFIDPLNS